MSKQQSFASYVLYKILGCYFLVALFVYGMMLALTYQELQESQKYSVNSMAKVFAQQFAHNPLGLLDNASLRARLSSFLNSGVNQNGVLGATIKNNSSATSLFLTSTKVSLGLAHFSFPVGQGQEDNRLILYVSDAKVKHAFYDKCIEFVALLTAQMAILWLLLRYFVVKVVSRSSSIMTRELENLNLLSPKLLHGDPRLSRFFEYQKLMDSVNRMIHSLASSRQDLVALNGSLESRINEKTASLEEKNVTLVQLNKKLSILANTDALTQVYNRTRFDLLFREHVEVAEKRHTTLSVLLVDLDYFKLVNDQYGHQVGDHVLKKAAQLLSDQVGDEGVVARWGGEEFAVLLPYYKINHALYLAESLRLSLSNASFEEQHIHITMSIGAAELMANETSTQLLKRADAALYCAKDNGRDQVVCSDASSVKQLPLSGFPSSD